MSELINFRIPSNGLAPAREFQLIGSSMIHLMELLLILAEWESQTSVKFSSVKSWLLLDMTIQRGPINNYQNYVDTLLHSILLCRLSNVLLACKYKTDSSFM
jgi:hypothetical protein